jgi:hypothetical protein
MYDYLSKIPTRRRVAAHPSMCIMIVRLFPIHVEELQCPSKFFLGTEFHRG